MDYLESGFNEFLQRPVQSSGGTSSLDFDNSVEGISGQTITSSGSLTSKDGQIDLNLNGGNFVVSDNSVKRVELGRLADGTVGLIIRDQNGNELLHFSGSSNILKSPDGNLEIDFDKKRLLVRNDSGVPQVLLGKDPGGF